jgi:hypothetical protein
MPAAAAARTAKMTHVHRVGRKPAVTAAGLPRLPCAENTALLIAMAKTVPSRCAIWLTPAVGRVGRAMEMPMPAISRAPASDAVRIPVLDGGR